MSNNKVKESKKEHNKKIKKTFTLMFDNEEEIDKKDICMDSNVRVETDEIERISKEYPYGENGKYRNFVFYEHENEHVLLKIVLRDVEGYYAENKGINNMNFMLNGSVYDVIFDVFEDIEKKSNIENIIYSFETSSGFEYLKTNVPRNVAFKVDGIDNITPYTSERYLCNTIIETQHVQHEKKDEDEDVKYYLQICLTDCYCNTVKKMERLIQFLNQNRLMQSLNLNLNPKSKSKSKCKAESKDE